MNEVPQKFFMIAIAFSLCISYGFTTYATIDANDTLDSQIIISTKLAHVSQADMDEIRKEARKALLSIPPILGIENRKTIRIEIVDTGICNAIGGVISLPVSHVRGKHADIIHEITHIIAKHGNSSFFSEGLAIYFQDRFGEVSGFPNYSDSLDDLVRKHRNQLVHIRDLMNNNGIFEQVGTELRRIAYIEAGSFINFLVEQYGEEKLADLHNSRFLDYNKVYGREIEELEKEWKSNVLGLPS